MFCLLDLITVSFFRAPTIKIQTWCIQTILRYTVIPEMASETLQWRYPTRKMHLWSIFIFGPPYNNQPEWHWSYPYAIEAMRLVKWTFLVYCLLVFWHKRIIHKIDRTHERMTSFLIWWGQKDDHLRHYFDKWWNWKHVIFVCKINISEISTSTMVWVFFVPMNHVMHRCCSLYVYSY